MIQVFRKGRWRCSDEHCSTPQKDLDLDHVSGHPGEIVADPYALHVICKKRHDACHSRKLEIGAGKKPEPMRGQG